MNNPTYRQYIGARYVPKFFENSATGDSTWASGTAYEPLTIVTWNSNSYTSKKHVPATIGAPNLNLDYWVVTSDYSADISYLRSAVNELDGRVDDLEETVDDLDERLDDVEEAVDKLKRKYIFIGDSYNTTDTPPGGTQIVPWSSLLVNDLGITSADYYNSGISGAGFVHSPTFLSQLQTLSATITDKEKITDIVVLGGINDYSNTDEEINAGIVALSEYAATNYPNAIVTIGMISWTTDVAARIRLGTMINQYKVCGSLANVRSIDNAYTFYHNMDGLAQADGHPNALGSAAIATGIANYLKGGVPEYNFSAAGFMTKAQGQLPMCVDLFNLAFYWQASGGVASLSLKWNTEQISDISRSVALSGGGVIGQINTRYFRLNDAVAQGFGWIYTSDNKYIPISYQIIMHGFEVQLRYQCLDSGVGSSSTATVIHLYDPTTISTSLLDC